MFVQLQLVSYDMVKIEPIFFKIIFVKGLKEITKGNRIVNTPTKSRNTFSSITRNKIN